MKFVEHLNSCARQCIAIADVLKKSFRRSIPIKRDYLIAGALLADVGKPLEYDKDASGNVIQGKFGHQVRHPFSGVALAYKHGIPGEVLHIIATHSHEGRQDGALDRVDYLPSCRFRGFRYRQSSGKTRGQEAVAGIADPGRPASPMPATTDPLDA
jgi:putative nucleotidyltransferase with HDIG domain